MTNNEINEAVARKLGWKDDPDGWIQPNGPWFPMPPAYSTKIEAAWEILEHCCSRGFAVKIEQDFGMEFWRATICDDRKIETKCCLHEDGDTAPLAICLAFLKLEDK